MEKEYEPILIDNKINVKNSNSEEEKVILNLDNLGEKKEIIL